MGIVKFATSRLVEVARAIAGMAVAPDFWTGPILRLVAAQGQLPTAVAATLPRVVIVGEGGAGKSTLLKQMLANAAGTGHVPVWVALSALSTTESLTPSTLVDHLVGQAKNNLGLDEINRAFFEALVRDGRLAIGFDALDECGSLARRQKVRGLIVDVAREWKRCRVFVTSRPDALRDTPLPLPKEGQVPKDESEFFGLTPRPFTRNDIAPFLRAAFDDGEQLAKEVLRRTGIEALTETPLTLSLVGLVARSPKGLPAARTPLFARVLDTVCEAWEDAKGSQSAAERLDPDQCRDVLRRLGWEAQRADGDTLDARAARSAIAQLPDIGSPARAKKVVDALARRNLLLRAELADDGGLDVERIRFAHPQFREYLAGSHLAEQFALDATTAAAAMAPYWFESGWLDVLRFAITTVERDASRRDGLLRAALAAKDPYRDLLHRPDFLTARLLASVPSAEAALVASVVACLERVAIEEPALRDAAAQALLALGRHPPAVPAIERFARGDGIGRVFRMDQSSFDASVDALRWRLRAIESLAPAHGAAMALTLLPDDPPGLTGVLEVCELRARLGDRAGAFATWEQLFNDASGFYSSAIAASMDKSGESKRFNSWLLAALDGDDARIGDARLARERGILADDAPVWTRLFAQASAQLAALDADAVSAPPEVLEAVYLATEPDLGAASPTGRALITAALRHPSLLWYVGPRAGKVMPELAAEAIRRLVSYVLEAPPLGSVAHDSRANVANQAVCDEPDDALAVPALLELLSRFAEQPHRSSLVADSLRRRGHAHEAFEVLRPQLQLPDGVDDRQPDDEAESRGRGWQLARTLDPARMVQSLDAMYRSGEPDADANRLMLTWRVSGVEAVARDWFRELAQHATDEGARRFLQTLTTHERDTGFTDEARHALYGGVFDDPFSDETLVAWTGADAERAFERALEHGSFTDERDRDKEATATNLVWLILLVAERSGEAAALRHADALVQRKLRDLDLPSGTAEAFVEKRVEPLLNVLHLLATSRLHDPRWMASVAVAARRLPAAARADLVTWLNANA